LNSGHELWRLRLSSFGGFGLALVALAPLVFGAYMIATPSFNESFLEDQSEYTRFIIIIIMSLNMTRLLTIGGAKAKTGLTVYSKEFCAN